MRGRSGVVDAANVLYAGVSPGTAGLYQLNIRVPAGLTDGDLSDQLTAGKSCHAARRLHHGEEPGGSCTLRKKSGLRSDWQAEACPWSFYIFRSGGIRCGAGWQPAADWQSAG